MIRHAQQWFVDIILLGFGGTPRYSFPEVRGLEGHKAKAITDKENPPVTGVIMHPGDPPFVDICCNREVIEVNKDGVVQGIPYVA